jgi:hypothetical protein
MAIIVIPENEQEAELIQWWDLWLRGEIWPYELEEESE